MKLGLITDSVGHLPFEGVLDLAKEQGLSSVEVATGNWSTAPHADLSALVSSAVAREEFARKISSRGLTLSALCANGNQLHPVEGPAHDKVVRDSISVAAELGVPTVVLMSAFVTSELRTAFQLGFALFLPFIIIDVVVSSVLMSMGMFMLPPAMISLPFKLLLFVLVDGWNLIIQSLVAGFK